MDRLRRVLLNRLRSGDCRLYYIWKDCASPEFPKSEVVRELWMMLADHLLFLDVDTQNILANWHWLLTDRGRRMLDAKDDFDPEDGGRYLMNLSTQIADLDLRIVHYVKEALRTYSTECYLASSVMLGVASERAFQLLGEAFAGWLGPDEAKRFRDVFDKPRQTYIAKFHEFRQRIEPLKNRLPEEFAENMALTLDSVLDLLRVTRNDAGHPSGRDIDKDTAYINLQIFARYLKKLYALRRFFLENARDKANPC